MVLGLHEYEHEHEFALPYICGYVHLKRTDGGSYVMIACAYT